MKQCDFSNDDAIYDVSYSNWMRILESAILQERLSQNRAKLSFLYKQLTFEAPWVNFGGISYFMNVKNVVDIYFNCICKLNYIDTDMSQNNQNYCGVSYFWSVTKTVNKRSLGQNDTAWLGQNDTVWNNLIWLCFKAFFKIFLSKLSIPITTKLNDTAMSEKYQFIFQKVKNERSTVSFCPVAKHKAWMVTNVTQKIQKTVCVQSYFRGDI